MARRKQSVPTEAELQRRWVARHLEPGYLKDLEGQRLRIIFAGWPNRERGPDFRGAILKPVGGPAIRGDIELHRERRGWREHGHDRDARYRSVVLHVLGQAGAVEGDATEPELAAVFRPAATARADLRDPRPCVRHREQLTPTVLLPLLEHEGLQRLTQKSSVLALQVEQVGLEETLWRGLARGMGHGKNEAQFAALAAACGRAQRASPDVKLREALLFGTAGLLPAQRGGLPDAYGAELEELWRDSGASSAVAFATWQFFRIRPQNAPPRRIAALAALSPRLPQLAALLREAWEDAALRNALALPPSPYWERHWDFGRESAPNPMLLGSSKVAELILNVCLPLAYATNAARRKALEERYATLPALAENRVTKTMRELLGLGTLRLTARQQQGLIGLYKKRCAGLFCNGCALS